MGKIEESGSTSLVISTTFNSRTKTRRLLEDSEDSDRWRTIEDLERNSCLQIRYEVDGRQIDSLFLNPAIFDTAIFTFPKGQ